MQDFENFNPTQFKKAIANHVILIECGDTFIKVTRVAIMKSVSCGGIKTIKTFKMTEIPGYIYVTSLSTKIHI